MLLIAKLAENRFCKHMAEVKLFQFSCEEGDNCVSVLLKSAGS